MAAFSRRRSRPARSTLLLCRQLPDLGREGVGTATGSVPARECGVSMNKARAVLRAFEFAEKGL